MRCGLRDHALGGYKCGGSCSFERLKTVPFLDWTSRCFIYSPLRHYSPSVVLCQRDFVAERFNETGAMCRAKSLYSTLSQKSE